MEKSINEIIDKLSRDDLKAVLLRVEELLSDEQNTKLSSILDAYAQKNIEKSIIAKARMSKEFVDEKMEEIKKFMTQLEEGKLYLSTEEYEDYSSGYWDSGWITEYYDNQGIGDKLLSAIQFAKDCVDDRRYEEANFIYEWVWQMEVPTDSEWESDPVDFEMLLEHEIIRVDVKQTALLTLYADYQAQEPNMRAEDIFLYFSYSSFSKLHIEEMFHVGRENLSDIDQFWKDWIELLQKKKGDTAGRLLQEAVLYTDGLDGLEKIAYKNASTHPILFLSVMEEYEKIHDYERIECVGDKALDTIDINYTIRAKVSLKAAYSASVLMHTNKMMRFCWEAFRSDSTVKNYLRLFGTEEMAKQYGMKGKEVLVHRIQRISENNFQSIRDGEQRLNIIGEFSYYELSFYMGDFEAVKKASRDPNGSLGWSSCFAGTGIRMFLLYLYDSAVPSEAAAFIANEIGFSDDVDTSQNMDFENKLIEESRKNKVSLFWNYFSRWKTYYPMKKEEQKEYIMWAEKIVKSRADAIVGGQFRMHYASVAVLLAMIGDIKGSAGEVRAKQTIYLEYKKKFPRHSSFQAQMKRYFPNC